MVQLVDKYNDYVGKLPEIISNSDYKAEYFVNRMEISKATFYRKLRDNSFTIKEVEVITRLLYPTEFYKLELLKSLNKSKEQSENGEVITHEEVMRLADEKLRDYHAGLR